MRWVELLRRHKRRHNCKPLALLGSGVVLLARFWRRWRLRGGADQERQAGRDRAVHSSNARLGRWRTAPRLVRRCLEERCCARVLAPLKALHSLCKRAVEQLLLLLLLLVLLLLLFLVLQQSRRVHCFC